MEPSRAEDLVQHLSRTVEAATATGHRPVLISSTRIRRHIRALIQGALPQLPVLAYGEITPDIRVESAGIVGLARDTEAVAA
jgi:flagellar biosynthesis protein FlhA